MFGSKAVTMANLSEARPEGLTEGELWPVFRQAVRSLRDLLVSDEKTLGEIVPFISPETLEIHPSGRVLVRAVVWNQVRLKECQFYLAPECHRKQENGNPLWKKESDWEKMWIYSLGKTLLACSKKPEAEGRWETDLEMVLNLMTRTDPDGRPSLKTLQRVASERRKTNFSARLISRRLMMDDSHAEDLDSEEGRTDFFPRVFQCLSSSLPQKKVEGSSECNQKLVEPEFPHSEEKVSSETSSVTVGRRNPVQRVPYRLHSGPEFIVRGTETPKMLNLGEVTTNSRRQSSLVVVMLTGEKFEMVCRPRSITCGHVLEALVREGKLEDDYLFGLACPIDGDFVFLPPEMKLHKVAPTGWVKCGKSATEKCVFLLHLRVKFFLPSLREVKNPATQHLMYLQLRRNLLDRQTKCELKELMNLGGLALQAEFGDFDESEHGLGAYFLLEHYLPEETIEDGRTELENRLRDLHRSRSGLDRTRAEYIFVSQVQMLPEYGFHHHAGLWTTKSGSIPVWVTVNSRGICLHEKKQAVLDRHMLDSFIWKNIRRLSYDENYFLLVPRPLEGRQRMVRYKFRMENKKSFFLFRLASLHHRFFLKSRLELDSPEALRKEFGSSSGRDPKRSKFYLEGGTGEGRREKEKRRERSGARFLGSRSLDNEDKAHVIEASIRSSRENFRYDLHESIASCLADEFSAVSWEEERILRKCRLSKAGRGTFGLRVVEGSNGGIFVANEVDSLRRGDQLIAVNDVCLLNLNYTKALSLIEGCRDEIEILVSRKCGSETFAANGEVEGPKT